MNTRLFRLHALGLCLALTGAGLSACGQKMMQTPVMFDGARIDPFKNFDASQRTNEVMIFYATNRPARGSETDRHYGNGIREELSLGEARVRLGGKNMSWEELYEISTSAKRRGSVSLHLENATELAVLEPEDDAVSPPADVRAFARRINDALAGKKWKDVTIYIHGAKVDFYHACVTAAEFHHFMGRHGVMLTFDWPSTQSLLTYGTDVKHARMSVPTLTRFLDFLAANTDAEHINLIGYSAGAQVLSPALLALREKYAALGARELQRKLRIGEVYFAAPDIDMRTFALEHAPRYHDMSVSTTLTINLNDDVLALSHLAHGSSRAGRPDVRELSLEESELVIQLVDLPSFNVIDMGTSDPPTEANLKGHGYWHKSPWVSTDIIIQFIFHASPAQRGLEIDTAETRKAQVWYYPDDYPQRVVSRLQAYLATQGEQPARQEPLANPPPR